MGKYFGTDGFRGEANKNLTIEHAFKIGQFLGYYFKDNHEFVIGRDTRLSGSMLEQAISAGINSTGGTTYIVGVTTTPSIAYVTKTHKYACGIMISASHNPFYDNGIKLINANGEKMEEDVILKIEDYIDKMLISYGMDIIDRRMLEMFDWKKCSLEKIKKSVFKKIRKEQFEASLDWENAFVFIFTREQTRYRQVNYVKHPYIVVEEMSRFSCPYDYIKSRFNQLEAIGFETILSEYHSKRQRNLMTKDLRDKIALRDNYTCQICGKYMPDGVGLHIDHIIPVSKGGKSVPSNLQVLCSKCNGKKSGR